MPLSSHRSLGNCLAYPGLVFLRLRGTVHGIGYGNRIGKPGSIDS